MTSAVMTKNTRIYKRSVRRYVRRQLVTPSLPARAASTAEKPRKASSQPKRMLALLIAAHNEELVLENTIRSAIHAGMKPEDIYVVDDNSHDTTSKIARAIIGSNNTFKVRHS